MKVSRLMEWAGKEGVCLIPFGGGTSVTRALEVPPLTVEPRPVVSVDMRKVWKTAAVLNSSMLLTAHTSIRFDVNGYRSHVNEMFIPHRSDGAMG